MRNEHSPLGKAMKGLGVLLLVLCLTLGTFPAVAAQEISGKELNRLNVMLVIDGSGSLVVGSQATDRKGLRYDAIDLFLALLTNSGNHVGAVVFDENPLLNQGLENMDGKADKLALSNQIRKAGTGNDTDIGSALLTAVDASAAAADSNGLESVVILFSDGRTDLGDNQEALAASLENKEAAIVKAQEAGIPVYSICLNATPVADPGELKEISDRTGGEFVEVNRPEDLTSAFETFYNLVFSCSANNKLDASFPADGKLSFEISVPSYGAEEVNVILDTSGLKERTLQSPTGVLSEAEMEEATMSGGYYDVIKLVNPQVGTWTLDLTGVPEKNVTINVIYNIDSTAVLDTQDGSRDYASGDAVTFTAWLYQQGAPVRDSAVTRDYTAQLELTNLASGQSKTLPMTPNSDGSFTYTYQSNSYESYSARAILSCESLVLDTNTVDVNFGNTAPRGDTDYLEEKVTVTPISGRSRSYAIADHFTDDQDKNLTYSVVSSQLVQDTVDLDPHTGALTVNTAKSRSGNLVLRATDSQGAYCEMTIRFKVTNLTTAIFATIATAVIVGAIVLLAILYRATHRPWKGMFHVVNADPSRPGMDKPHANVYGKVKLEYFGVGDCGMDPRKCVFAAAPGNRLEFRSPKEVYVNNQPTKVVPLMGSVTIYADDRRTRGIKVTVKPNTPGFRGGPGRMGPGVGGPGRPGSGVGGPGRPGPGMGGPGKPGGFVPPKQPPRH